MTDNNKKERKSELSVDVIALHDDVFGSRDKNVLLALRENSAFDDGRDGRLDSVANSLTVPRFTTLINEYVASSGLKLGAIKKDHVTDFEKKKPADELRGINRKDYIEVVIKAFGLDDVDGTLQKRASEVVELLRTGKKQVENLDTEVIHTPTTKVKAPDQYRKNCLSTPTKITTFRKGEPPVKKVIKATDAFKGNLEKTPKKPSSLQR